MARTALYRAARNQAPWPRGQGACGFCDTPTMAGAKHDLCPGVIPKGAGGKDWTCACHAAGHDVKGAQ